MPDYTIDDNRTEIIIDVYAISRLENVVIDLHDRKDGSD